MNLPTQLTVLRIVLTPIFVYTIFLEQLIFKYISFVIFTIASLTDLYDGYYAKKYGYVTKWGKFLDPLADKILVSSALIVFYVLGYIRLWIVIAIILRDFLITALRSYAILKDRPMVTREWARWKTFIQMSSIFLIFIFLLIEHVMIFQQKQYSFVRFVKSIGIIDKLMILVVAFTVTTGVLYFIENRGQLKSIFISCYRTLFSSS